MTKIPNEGSHIMYIFNHRILKTSFSGWTKEPNSTKELLSDKCYICIEIHSLAFWGYGFIYLLLLYFSFSYWSAFISRSRKNYLWLFFFFVIQNSITWTVFSRRSGFLTMKRTNFSEKLIGMLKELHISASFLLMPMWNSEEIKGKL